MSTLRSSLAWIAVAAAVVSVSMMPSSAAPKWQLLDDGDPGPNTAYLTYDASRQRVVAVQNSDILIPDITWELVGDNWQRRFVPTPLVDDAACATYDAARGVVVALGQVNDGTWTYDGATWLRRNPTQQPSARASCRMVYDSIRQRVVLFGGYRFGVGSLQDTWEWNGSDWTSITTANKPARRSDHGLAYDSARGVVVLHGGRQDGAIPLNDTWEYNGSNWVSKTSTLPQPLRARWGIELSYHPMTGKTYLFGGTNSVVMFNDTWQWNGTTWTQVVTPHAPSPRWYFRMTYAADRQKIVGWGGETSDESIPRGTWQFDGVDWVEISTGSRPLGRANHAMAYDSRQRALVVFGGKSIAGTTGNFTDTWLWSPATNWQLDADAGEPSANLLFSIVDEPSRSRVIGFSGVPPGQALPVPGIHEYSGANPGWFDSPAVPTRRQAHGWVDAPELGGVVLFGGLAEQAIGGMNYSNETWVLSGSSWSLQTPAHAPQPRDTIPIAYDSTRREVLIYGGEPRSPDLWAFNGTDWVLRDPSPAPGWRRYSRMAFDPGRSRTVIYGGGPVGEQFTWEYDGNQWTAVSTPFQPDTERGDPTLTYAPDLDVILLFGGASDTDWNDLWAYGDDPDDDGIVGGLDNCRQLANANQLNSDGDAAGDVCDCAPGNPAVFRVPSEVVNVLMQPDDISIRWESLIPTSGSGTVYDLVRGRVGEWPVGSGAGETCVSSGLTSSSAIDSFTPPPATASWYLVRGRNACGSGGYGSTSSGTTRSTVACP